MSTVTITKVIKIPGFFAVIPTIYIPMINCVKVIAEKKATIRFLLRVSAYRLFKKLVIGPA